jgi:glutathione S-transferase
MKLYWHPFSVFPRRIRIALREKGIAYEEVVVDLPGGALRGAEFRRLNPFGQVPVLEDGDLVISESIAILEYLEERHPAPPLLPADAASRAAVRQLMLWSGDYLAPEWEAWVAPWFSDVKPDDPAVRAWVGRLGERPAVRATAIRSGISRGCSSGQLQSSCRA